MLNAFHLTLFLYLGICSLMEHLGMQPSAKIIEMFYHRFINTVERKIL